MPIDKNEWDQGRTWETTESQIRIFLNKNQGKAFTASEIASALGRIPSVGGGFLSVIGGALTYWVIQEALETLIKEGKARAKVVKHQIGEETYYMAV